MIKIEDGISIIMHDWLDVKKDELVHFITDEKHLREAQAVSKWAQSEDAILKLTILPSHLIQNGDIIDKMVDILKNENIIIGATSHSFITTGAVKTAINKGARFLSIPLDCNDGSSLLENDFITMNCNQAKKDAKKIIRKLTNKNTIHVTTKLGTDLTLSIEGRTPNYFCGPVKRRSKGSASFEVYIAPIENSCTGTLILDASIGYLGLIQNPIKITFNKGRIISATSKGDDADKFLKYIESFKDKTMYKPGEFGIGLNRKSKCRGICYIEDESVYSTFHIGMGRNLTLGGKQVASGHFDIITNKPTIYADNTLIMKDGELL